MKLMTKHYMGEVDYFLIKATTEAFDRNGKEMVVDHCFRVVRKGDQLSLYSCTKTEYNHTIKSLICHDK